MRSFLLCAVLLGSGALALPAAAQQPSPSQTAVTTCTFADGKEISLRYNPANPREQMPSNKPWGPGGSPMYLFTQASVTVGNTTIAPDAYSVYVIGGREPWKLVINKDVKIGSKYDASKDLVRVPMDSGELPSPEKELRPYFVHAAPQQCNLRLYYQKTGAWAEFKEK